MKTLRWIGLSLMAIVLIAVIALFVVNEKEPTGYKGTEADKLAKDMLTALNYDAFNELKYLQFTFFRGKHHYRWDKANNVAEVVWDDKKVVMQLDTKEAKVIVDGAPVVEEAQKAAYVNEAWKYWCNDSFWMIAPYKIFDAGTERSIIETVHANTKGLKVHYASGGYTPGDSYVWEIGPDNKPVSWKMWTSILPVKGMETTWEKWIDVEGALLSTYHSNPVLEMEMQNIKGGNDLTALGWAPDTFSYK